MKATTQTKTTKRKAHPFAHVLGSFYVSEELGIGQFVEEVEPCLWRCECYTNPTQPSCLTKYICAGQLTEVTLCKDKAVWLDMLQGDGQCDCEACSDECDEDELCMCPDCFAERVEIRKDIAQREAAEQMEAIAGTVMASVADTRS